MTESQYIGLVNITGGVLAIHLVFLFARWVWRDWRSLSRIAAGMLVFVFLVAMIFRGYESLYYGAARLLAPEINLWQTEPWTTIVGVVRTGGIGLLLAAYAAKTRADGRSWRTVGKKTAGFALEGVAIAVAVYLILIA